MQYKDFVCEKHIELCPFSKTEPFCPPSIEKLEEEGKFSRESTVVHGFCSSDKLSGEKYFMNVQKSVIAKKHTALES